MSWRLGNQVLLVKVSKVMVQRAYHSPIKCIKVGTAWVNSMFNTLQCTSLVKTIVCSAICHVDSIRENNFAFC